MKNISKNLKWVGWFSQKDNSTLKVISILNPNVLLFTRQISRVFAQLVSEKWKNKDRYTEKNNHG